MSGACPVIADSAGVVERLAGYVECQSQQIDLAAFQGGLWHGLPAVMVSALMALYVAGFGYRLLLHHHLDTASLVYAVLRLGVVIAVATTFSAYSALVYSVSIQGPQDVAAMALAPAGLHAPSLTQASHAAAAYLDSLDQPSHARPAPPPQPQLPGGDPSVRPPSPESEPAASPDSPGRDSGRAVFLLSCVGFGLAARLAQTVVLAVGPLFVAAALFDMSMGLFVGWLRALVALFLAQTGYAVTTALELSFFTRDLSHLSQASAEGGEPLLIGLFFLAAGAAITVMAILAAGGLVRVDLARRAGAFIAARTATGTPPAPRSPWPAPEVRTEPPVSRVQRVTDAVGALAVADQQRLPPGHGGAVRAGDASGGGAEPLAGAGAGLRRPGQLRASTGAAKRDLIS